MKEFTIIFLVM